MWKILKKIIHTDLQKNTFILDDIQLRKRLAPETKTIVKENDSIYYMTLNDGFGKLNLSKLRNQLNTIDLPEPKLSSFHDDERKYALQKKVFDIPYDKSQNLSINVSAGSYEKYRYYYELQGAMEQSSYLNNGSISFQNLPFGTYQLQIHTVGISNEMSTPKKVEFEILPPWYLSKWFMLVYALLFVGIVFLIRLYNKNKLERKHKKLEEKLHREQEERLAFLEKEKLNKEIKSKQKELTNTTMKSCKEE